MTIVASIYGRLSRDPEQRTTKSGAAMVIGNLAVDARDGRTEEQETLWVSLLAFGSAADSLSQAAKGQSITAMGRLTRGRFQGRDGQERESWTMLADAVLTAASAKPGGRKRTEGQPQPPRQPNTQPAPFDDEIPF